MTRLYLDPPEFAQSEVAVSGDRARRLTSVLRLRRGATLTVFDGVGHEREAALVEVGRDHAMLALGAPAVALPEPLVPVTLCCAFPRGGRGDWLVEKATELGVVAFVPLETDRAVLKPGDGRLDRWRRIAIEAAEQCGRAVVPAFEMAPPREALRLVADLGATSTPREVLTRVSGVKAIALYIGPEGGWTEAERAAHAESGHPVSLGPRTLRVETAAAVALALILEALSSPRG
ncbi:MAG: 16S rRNA (uracil(1498)-N(3))-methyltransferase [Dehalococcoidia bacterium]|nr:16S rRNA (uracil(1498)-N(3))-methyltransferase [Dehalococcoidia bacterium]